MLTSLSYKTLVFHLLVSVLLGIGQVYVQAQGVTSYANDFVDPNYILAGGLNSSTKAAQATIISWAQTLAGQGPWTVTSKTVTPPSGDIHDYMSWAPYSFPDCSSVGNTSALTPQQIWTTCPYVTRDGDFNPDLSLVPDSDNFSDLSDAVLYNAIAWAITNKSSIYSANITKFISTWFLDDATKMNPNLNYAQMARGPNGQVGQHEGVLDLKCMTKVVSGLLILRKGGAPEWTPALDAQMISWTNTYIQWLETADIAVKEAAATNNHGTYYYNQLAALKLLVNDVQGASNAVKTYFSNQFLAQINANGEQPLEASRSRPYHYRAYNLAAMITNARLAKYADPTSDPWHATTSAGATIKTALDFTMALPVPSDESSAAAELFPDVAAVAVAYGDPQSSYAAFLRAGDSVYPRRGFFLWDQPLSDSGIVLAGDNTDGAVTSASRATTAVKAKSTTSKSKASPTHTALKSGVGRISAGGSCLLCAVTGGCLFLVLGL